MTIHSTISQSFMSHGTQGIDATYKTERLIQAAEARRNAATTGLRHSLGNMIISLGALIAGTTTTIQDRHATMPTPDPKPGFVPTR